MPYTQYMPRKEPPTFMDRVYSDPMAVVLAIGSGINGVLLALSALVGLTISRALEGLPDMVLVVLSLAMLVGSFRLLHAALVPRKNWSDLDGLRAKWSGSMALVCGWTGYGISVLFTGNAFATVTIVMSLSLAGGYALHTRALQLNEQRAKQLADAE